MFKRSNNKSKIVLKRVAMTELQIKLFDYFHKERKFKKRDAKKLCKDVGIASFEDWLMKYECNGCLDLPQRCMGVFDYGNTNFNSSSVVSLDLYDSEDEDCNDHFFLN
jgi:hypothetical protein